MNWSEAITAAATVAGALIALSGLTIAASATRTSAAVNHRNQQSNVILHCSLRYDQLYELKLEIGESDKLSEDQDVSKSPLSVKTYFNRYFGLESDQIDFWLAGFIDPDSISTWLSSLADSLHRRDVGGYTFKSGWNYVVDHHKVMNPTLYEIVDGLINFQSKLEDYSKPEREKFIAAKISSLLKEAERKQSKIIWRLSALDTNRFTAAEFEEQYLDERIRKAVYKIENGNGP